MSMSSLRVALGSKSSLSDQSIAADEMVLTCKGGRGGMAFLLAWTAMLACVHGKEPQNADVNTCHSKTCSRNNGTVDDTALLQSKLGRGSLQAERRPRRRRSRLWRGRRQYSYYQPAPVSTTSTSSEASLSTTSTSSEAPVVPTTTTATPAPPMWTLGELHDTCNDYCQFLGYSGCDLAEMETVDTEEELAVEMQNLGKTCLVNGSIWNEIATYAPGPSGCYLNKPALDCDSNRQEKHQPLCYCIGTTTTTTPVGWVFGELHDTCNDYCQYTGYAGCDFDRIVEINRIPRARRLLESLNYTCDVSDGDWNNVPTYRPDLGGCYYNRNPLSCDANRREENQPVCACNGTAPPPSPPVGWVLGELHDTCNDYCQYTGYAGCDFDRIVEINRIPRARRLLESLNYTCDVSEGDWNNVSTYRPDLGGCYYNRLPLSCDANGREENQPVCACNGTAPPPSPPVGWVLGELHDTCNDYCQYTGYAGCDFDRIVEINRIPRARRLLESLNYTCNASETSGDWNNVPTYRPDLGGCYYNRNALSCDANRREENQPVCACKGTAPSPSPPVGWVLGELHDTCNDYCRYTGYAGCDFDRIVEINRIPRARRLLESLNYTCDVSEGDWNNVPTYRPDLGGCYYNRNALSCDANRREENQPVCACNGTAPSPTPLDPNWVLGPLGGNCDATCAGLGKACDATSIGEINRIPRARRLLQKMNYTCDVSGGQWNKLPTYEPGTNGCYYNRNPVDCSVDVSGHLQPLCYCTV
ncbi:unnamed protein product [Symbiodinium sp. CCMP2456]|nr:unnamed protein product [Symbiodinium sp. CCMP2456]